MTALSNLYAVIDANPTWAGKTYIKSVPENIGADKTFIIVRDSTQQLLDFASNSFQTMQFDMQVQIFYSNESDDDFDQVEMELMRYLQSNGYFIENVRGRIQDPDTFQDYQTIILGKQERN